MIFYFSATGNSLYVAKRIAAEGEKLIYIPEALDKGEFHYDIEGEERLGIISPTYDWTMPSVVSEFLEKLELDYITKPYVYYVGTFGTTTGAAAAMANRYMEKKGCGFDALFDVKMPDTWTPIFDLSDEARVAKINLEADEQIGRVKVSIADKVAGKHMHITTPLVTGVVGKRIYDANTRCTKNLILEDGCIGCGLCARRCPVHAIEMQDNRPVWVKDRCAMCLGCLHRCPKFAIQYGRNTRKHGQYRHG